MATRKQRNWLFARGAQTKAKRRSPLARQLRFEQLENRRLLTAVTPITVTTASDAISHSGVSLRDAITTANNDAFNGNPAIITFASNLDGQTFNLVQGTLAVGKGTPSGTTYTAGTITIDAGNENIAISGNNLSGVFGIHSAQPAVLNGLTIENASTTLGGGISNAGVLTVNNCVITHNNVLGDGGGIYTQGILVINNSTISANTSSSGGGIYNVTTATVNNCVVSGNSATNGSGGISNSHDATLTVSGSTISSNTATDAAGIGNTGAMTIDDSTVSNNIASDDGGGIYSDLGASTVSNSTIYGNSATNAGGGLITFPGDAMTVVHSTIAKNSSKNGGGIDDEGYAGDTTLLDDLVAENSASVLGPDLRTSANSKTAGSYDLIGDGTGMFGLTNGSAGNQVGTSASAISPSLGPLQNNGGTTQTMALLAGSPAINAGGPITTLGAAIGITDTTITVANVSAIANESSTIDGAIVIKIGSEEMSVLSADPSTNTLTVGRGFNNTTATTHASGSTLTLAADQIGDPRVGNSDIGALEYNAGAWSVTGSMNTARNVDAATLLGNGEVLVAGGQAADASAIASAELYNPATGTWSATGSLHTARYSATTTLLANGEVLVAGGFNGSWLSTAELYNPATGTWSYTGSLNNVRSDATATLLANGEVLVAGGYSGSAFLSGAELYNPATGTWTATGSLNIARDDATATLLENGEVLVVGGLNTSAGGNLSSAELYNPATGTWTATGSLNVAHGFAAATLLDNGEVLVAGGFTGNVLSSAELYNPTTGTWSVTGSLNTAREWNTSTLLDNGEVLIAGGYGAAGYLTSAELYNPATGTWSATGSLTSARATAAAVLINGEVLIAGGATTVDALASAELYGAPLTTPANDPGFENSGVSAGAWQYAPTDPPWTFTGTAGVSGNYSAITGGNPVAPEGSQVAFVQMTGSISETVTLAAGTYTVDFMAAQRENYNHGGQVLQVSVDGTAEGSITPAGANYALYASANFTISAAGSHTITITGLNPHGGDNTAIIDSVAVQTAVTATQLTDPDFAAVSIGAGNWQYAPSGSPWTFAGTAGVTGNGSAITGGNPSAPQGSQVAFVQMAGSIGQQVSLSAGSYALDFSAAQRGNYNHGGQTMQVSVDGTAVGTVTPASTNYALYSVPFTATAGTHTITITGLNPSGGDNTALVDNVSVQAAVTATQLSDPDFAAVSIGAGNWAYAPSGSPWTFNGTAGVSGNGSSITGGNPNAPQGTQVGFIQFTGSMSQQVSLTAGSYTLDLTAAQRGNYNHGGQTLQVSVDGTAVGTVTPAGTSYALYAVAFTATAGTHTITIAGLNPQGNDNTAIVDNVSVQPAVTATQLADPNFSAVSIGAGNWAYAPSGSPWTFAGTAGVSGNGSSITGGNPNAPQGSQVGFIQFTGSISQQVSLTAGSYTLNFTAAQRENYNHGGQALRVSVDGTAVGSITPAGSNYGLYSVAFTATAGPHTITIAGLNPQGGDNTAIVDNVSVQPAVTTTQLVDPNFGSVSVGAGNWQYAPSGSPWTFVGTAGVSGNGSAITGGNPNAPQGSQVGFIQFTGSVSQQVSLTAGTYTLDFSAAQRGNYNHGGQSLQVLVDGTAKGNAITPAGTNYAGYTSISFTVSTGMHQITIQGLNPQGNDNTALIDQVMLSMA